MRILTLSLGALLLSLIALSTEAQAGDSSAERPSVDSELRVNYPRVPKTLDGDPAQSSVLLVEFEFRGIIKMNVLDGAALARAGDDGAVIRASNMKRRLVMFNLADPGTYSLRFMRMSNGNVIVVLEKPPAISMNVAVARGKVSYLGTIVVTKKFGPKQPEMELIYDVEKETAAWSTFQEKYAASPWSALAEKRIAALKSGETSPPEPPAAGVSRDPVIHDACMRVYADEFRQKASDEGKAQVMEDAFCQVISGGCQKEPHGDPCLNSLRRLDESLGKSGRSLPLMAAFAGRTDLIKTLIEIGADINRPAQGATDLSSGTGWTPVMIAAAEGHPETVSILATAGAEVNATNAMGRTALMFASSRGSLPIVNDLLAHGADPNIVPKDQTGWTALMAATHLGHLDVIRALLEHGADASIGDTEGQTALAWAEAEGRADVAKVLKDATADLP